jgi:acyl carrier protein
MRNDDIVDEIAKAIRHVRRDDTLEIGRSTEIAELGVDSLDFVELLFSLEEKFNIDIPFNANEEGGFAFATVGNAADAIEDLLTNRASAA